MFISIDDKEGIKSSEKLSFEDGLRLLGTATLYIMRGCDEDLKGKLDADAYKEVHGRIYDMANIMFGNILDMYAPELAGHPDLTAEAILKAENEILDKTPVKEVDATEELVTPAEEAEEAEEA